MVKSWLAFLLLVACTMRAEADAGLARDFAVDAKLYVTAPLRWDGPDWLEFGGTLALVGIAHHYDEDVRAHFVTGGAALDGRDPHGLRDALPAAGIVVATWAGAFLAQSRDGYEEGRDMLEAAAFSAATTTLLKYAAGRRRPNETDDAGAWSRGGDSFPSLHTSAAFAIGTVLAEGGDDRHRWLRRALGYGIAGATAYARLHDNVHWLSDTVAGAAIGMSTARFVLRRAETRANVPEFSVIPVEGGLMLAWNATL